MISAQASAAAAANTALEDQGHEYKTVSKYVGILHASLHTPLANQLAIRIM